MLIIENLVEMKVFWLYYAVFLQLMNAWILHVLDAWYCCTGFLAWRCLP